MPNLLVSGPAGGGKSEVVRRERDLLVASGTPAIVVEFQSLYVALTGDERDTDTGRYPDRDPDLLPVTEYVRRAAISAATQRQIAVVASNSDGDPDRRSFLLSLLGLGARELVIDPGRVAVEARLAVDGELSGDCAAAVNRWYRR